MKRKSHPKRKISHRIHHRSKNDFVLGFNTITIVTSCLVLLFIILVIANKRTVAQSVAGISIMKGLWNEAIVPMPLVRGATSYNIYFRSTTDPTFLNAVRNIPPNSAEYTLQYLKKGTKYEYKVSAVGPTGGEYWFSDVKLITNAQSM